MAAIGTREIEALTSALEAVLEAIENMRETLNEFDALPPAESPGEQATRAWLRSALVKIQLEILLPPVTIYGVLKRIDPQRLIH